MLVEREQHVQELLDLAKIASSGRGAIALVGGEAGIGKTSVLEEMRLRASADSTVIWGGWYPHT